MLVELESTLGIGQEMGWEISDEGLGSLVDANIYLIIADIE